MLASGTATSHLSERAYKRYLKKKEKKRKNKKTINFLLFVYKKPIKRVKKSRKICRNEFFYKKQIPVKKSL